MHKKQFTPKISLQLQRKFLLSILTCLLLITGCKKGATKDPNAPLKIAVVPKGTTHEFWKSIHAGAIKASRELGVEIVWKGPLKEDNRDAQITVVETFINSDVDGIALAPLDDTALQRPVREAKRKGIPTVVFDSGLKGSDFVSFVATDNYAGGQKAGEHLGKLLNGKGKVIMLRYFEGSASTKDREEGFLEAIAKFEGIEVVSSNQHGGATTETSYQVAETLLTTFLDSNGKLTIDGMFCSNESTTFGMLRALQDRGLQGSIKFVGFDSSEMLIKALEDEYIQALVLQNPINMGYTAVKTITEHLKGRQVEVKIDTGSAVATKENMLEPRIADLLRPDYEKWHKMK